MFLTGTDSCIEASSSRNNPFIGSWKPSRHRIYLWIGPIQNFVHDSYVSALALPNLSSIAVLSWRIVAALDGVRANIAAPDGTIHTPDTSELSGTNPWIVFFLAQKFRTFSIHGRLRLESLPGSVVYSEQVVERIWYFVSWIRHQHSLEMKSLSSFAICWD